MHMKSNYRFSENQFKTVKNTFNSRFDVSQVNRTGNIKVSLNGNDDEYWILYYRNNGKFLWRRINAKTGARHPLNMITRYKRTVNCSTHVYEYMCYEINSSEFDTLNQALDYIKNYMCFYRGIEL